MHVDPNERRLFAGAKAIGMLEALLIIKPTGVAPATVEHMQDIVDDWYGRNRDDEAADAINQLADATHAGVAGNWEADPETEAAQAALRG
jgi:hypothetical protein